MARTANGKDLPGLSSARQHHPELASSEQHPELALRCGHHRRSTQDTTMTVAPRRHSAGRQGEGFSSKCYYAAAAEPRWMEAGRRL